MIKRFRAFCWRFKYAWAHARHPHLAWDPGVPSSAEGMVQLLNRNRPAFAPAWHLEECTTFPTARPSARFVAVCGHMFAHGRDE